MLLLCVADKQYNNKVKRGLYGPSLGPTALARNPK